MAGEARKVEGGWDLVLPAVAVFWCEGKRFDYDWWDPPGFVTVPFHHKEECLAALEEWEEYDGARDSP